MERKKSPNGTVSVQVFRGRLRLCWSYRGKRHYLYLGLPDGKTERLVAEAKAKLIQADIVTGNFDSTLAKYKPPATNQEGLPVVELFQKFIAYKSKHIYRQSLVKYQALLGHLNQFFRNKSATRVGDTEAEKFKAWLSCRVQPITVRERINLLNACWKWALQRRYVQDNPWQEVLKGVRVPPKQRPQPFSKVEMERIIEGFRSDRYYSHYSDYVEFLLGTGCRIEEAIALKWKHINEDCSLIWIGEAYYRGHWKEVKTNQARFLSLTPRLQKLLLARKSEQSPDDLVFPSPKGQVMDDHNFRNRPWKTVLTQLGIPYRKPYTTRSTLVSHALDLGMSPAAIAELTGHQIQTLFRHYAGNVQSRPRLPELLD